MSQTAITLKSINKTFDCTDDSRIFIDGNEVTDFNAEQMYIALKGISHEDAGLIWSTFKMDFFDCIDRDVNELPLPEFTPEAAKYLWTDVEVTPCRYAPEDTIQVSNPDNAQFWGVYLRYKTGQAGHIADVATKEQAEQLRDIILYAALNYAGEK